MGQVILFPTDGSATASAAGRVAAGIAKGEGDSIIVFAVAERPECEATADETVEAALLDYMKKIANEAAVELRALGAEVSTEVATASHVAEAIVDQARECQAAMVVMGTHGRHGLARTVIGSVADRVLRYSDVPVVLVPLKGGGR